MLNNLKLKYIKCFLKLISVLCSFLRYFILFSVSLSIFFPMTDDFLRNPRPQIKDPGVEPEHNLDIKTSVLEL